MSFAPIPVIPQTADQATQRDRQAGHAASLALATDPRVELQQLRQAIRDHRHAVETAGPLGTRESFTDAQVNIMDRKHSADMTLWAHIPA